LIDLNDKKYPAVSVQSVILATDVLFIEESPNLFIFLSIGLVLLLFTMQAVNHRFTYYFPYNRFTKQTTQDVDTYVLYGLSFFAIFFMLSGIFGVVHAILASIVICLSPFIWHYCFKETIRDRVTRKLKGRTYTSYGLCPCCGDTMVIKRRVPHKDWQVEVRACLGKCGRQEEKLCRYRIG
jgi:hypothetical protein